MDIRVSFFLNNKVIVASNDMKKAIDAINENAITTPDGKGKIIDPLLNGYVDYDSEKDAGYIQMLMSADLIEVNGGVFKVLRRELRANEPKLLSIYVEPLNPNIDLNYPNAFSVEVVRRKI